MKNKIIILTIAALIVATDCLAWGQVGHDTTCAIAEKHLSRRAKKKIKKILKGQSLVYWANWLDNASHTPEYEYIKPWHYKNVRISLPDIDVDFDDDGRGRVLQWVTEKYGQEKVAHIITYGSMQTKMAIKDVARVLEVPLDISNNLCKAIPDRLPDTPEGKPRKTNLANVLECVPEIQQAAASEDEKLRKTIQFARMLEGNVRGTGVHACGTIICRDDITDWVPVSIATDKDTKERLLVTQYEGSVIEDTGLIKMDFLGLKTLPSRPSPRSGASCG